MIAQEVRWTAWRTGGDMTGPGGGPRMAVGFWWHRLGADGRPLCGARPPEGARLARATSPRAPGTSCGRCAELAEGRP